MKAPQLILAGLLLIGTVANGAPGDELYVRPGVLVRTGGTRLNLYCMGSGSPTVVFDSGWEDWAPVWALVQPQVAKWTRACSYDRAGAGRSDPGPLPRTSVRIADELHGALRAANIPGPYVLVGHAFGGTNMRTFAARYTADLAGLVLVEADVGGADTHQGDVQLTGSLRQCRDLIAAGKPLPATSPHPGEPERTCAQQFFRGLPEKMWSGQLNAALLQLVQSKLALYDTFISEMQQLPADEVYLDTHSHSLGSIPIRVLSTGAHGIHALDPSKPANADEQNYQQEVVRAQAKWLQLSSNARQLFTDQSSEYIPLDQPGFVVGAIREVVSARVP